MIVPATAGTNLQSIMNNPQSNEMARTWIFDEKALSWKK